MSRSGDDSRNLWCLTRRPLGKQNTGILRVCYTSSAVQIGTARGRSLGYARRVGLLHDGKAGVTAAGDFGQPGSGVVRQVSLLFVDASTVRFRQHDGGGKQSRSEA
jgi:hypothetical protein